MRRASRRSLITTIGTLFTMGCLNANNYSGTNTAVLNHTEEYSFSDIDLKISIDQALARTSVAYFEHPDQRDTVRANDGAFVFIGIVMDSGGPIPPSTAFSLMAGTEAFSPTSVLGEATLSTIVMATDLEPPYPNQGRGGTLAFHLPPIDDRYEPVLKLVYAEKEIRWKLPSRLREIANQNTVSQRSRHGRPRAAGPGERPHR